MTGVQFVRSLMFLLLLGFSYIAKADTLDSVIEQLNTQAKASGKIDAVVYLTNLENAASSITRAEINEVVGCPIGEVESENADAEAMKKIVGKMTKSTAKAAFPTLMAYLGSAAATGFAVMIVPSELGKDPLYELEKAYTSDADRDEMQKYARMLLAHTDIEAFGKMSPRRKAAIFACWV